MKFIRRLVRNGSSWHVSLSPQMLDWLQWRAGQALVVEATLDREVRVRQARPEDMSAPVQAMTIDSTVPGSGR